MGQDEADRQRQHDDGDRAVQHPPGARCRQASAQVARQATEAVTAPAAKAHRIDPWVLATVPRRNTVSR